MANHLNHPNPRRQIYGEQNVGHGGKPKTPQPQQHTRCRSTAHPPHGNRPTHIQPTMANLHNSKPTAPICCTMTTATHHAPDPLRPRFTNHHPTATRSDSPLNQ
ncbi:hypothetical protein ACB098_10G109800 [Castanea mollissima]